jgi:hypothetical protein
MADVTNASSIPQTGKLVATIENLNFDQDVTQMGGSILLVSNFTVAAETRKGRRPSLHTAAPPEKGEALFDHLVASVRALGVPVETGTATAFRRRLQRSPVQNRRRRLWIAIHNQACNHSQVVRDLLEHSGVVPSTGLLVHRRPRRKIMPQHPPLAARLDDVADAVEQLTRRVDALRSIFPHQGQIGNQEFPFRIRDIARIARPCFAHNTKIIAQLTIGA